MTLHAQPIFKNILRSAATRTETYDCAYVNIYIYNTYRYLDAPPAQLARISCAFGIPCI